MNPFDTEEEEEVVEEYTEEEEGDEEFDPEPTFDLRANQQRFSDAYKLLLSKGYKNIQSADQAFSIAVTARVMGKNDVAAAANTVFLLFDAISD